MLLYAYSFNGHLTHSDAEYNRRLKLGETDRAGKLTADSTDREIYDRVVERIKQQDKESASEPPIILDYFFVDTNVSENVDDVIRDILITKYGAKVTRNDKRKNEWVIIPGESQGERLSLIEQAIADFTDGQLVHSTINTVTPHDVQQKMFVAANKSNKCVLLAGCGAGKTFAELQLLEHNTPGAKQVNMLITSGIELANQLSEELRYNTVVGLPFKGWTPVIVHSGKSVLPNVEATTDIETIANQVKNATTPVWVIVVYDSVRSAARGIAYAGYSVHTKVLDEAHRTVGHTRTKFSDAVLLKSDKQYSLTASYRTVRV